MEKIKPRWDNSIKNGKEIYEQTLRQLIPSLSDEEVQESLKKNEERITLKFNTCLNLINDIEHVVRNAKNTWNNIYSLKK